VLISTLHSWALARGAGRSCLDLPAAGHKKDFVGAAAMSSDLGEVRESVDSGCLISDTQPQRGQYVRQRFDVALEDGITLRIRRRCSLSGYSPSLW
jgi:hypothetical protein